MFENFFRFSHLAGLRSPLDQVLMTQNPLVGGDPE